MLFIVLVMLAVCIGLPLAYAWRVLRLDEATLAGWTILVADATVFVALVMLVGRWDMAGYYLRFGLVAVFLAAVLWSLKNHVWRPWSSREHPALRRHWTRLVSLAVFGAALVYVVSGVLAPTDARELAFPLRDGRFMVAQGGRVGVLNHHAGHQEQDEAADIVALDGLGYRARGIAPEELDRYEIFGKEIVAPCAGNVVAVRDGLPDLTPPESDRQNASGNNVIIDCGGFNVELAHFQRGSLAVAAGQGVSVGDVLGRVGNSGNTTEPHLHIHAVDDETKRGVAMSFGGRSPLRNRVFVN